MIKINFTLHNFNVYSEFIQLDITHIVVLTSEKKILSYQTFGIVIFNLFKHGTSILFLNCLKYILTNIILSLYLFYIFSEYFCSFPLPLIFLFQLVVSGIAFPFNILYLLCTRDVWRLAAGSSVKCLRRTVFECLRIENDTLNEQKKRIIWKQ